MNILYNTYPMAFHTPGGGEIQLQKYKESLEKNGVKIQLFNQWEPQFSSCDLVHFFSVVGGSVHYCNFVKQLGLPLILSSSLWVTEDTKHLYPMEEIRHQMFLADQVVANSDIECDQLSKIFDLPRNKFVTIYNGIDDIFFEQVESKLFRESYDVNERFILNVGNIEPRKNQLSLAEAMKEFPELKLVLIGHKRDESYSQKVLKVGGDQIIYINPLDHMDPLLRSAYAACEAFCLPSTLETPGLAALEAAASGCKIAITEVGATREYFGNGASYLDPSSISSIEEALRDVLADNEVVDLSEMKLFPWSGISRDLKSNYTTLIEQNQ